MHAFQIDSVNVLVRSHYLPRSLGSVPTALRPSTPSPTSDVNCSVLDPRGVPAAAGSVSLALPHVGEESGQPLDPGGSSPDGAVVLHHCLIPLFHEAELYEHHLDLLLAGPGMRVGQERWFEMEMSKIR